MVHIVDDHPCCILLGTSSASPGRDSPDFPRPRSRHVIVAGDSPLSKGSRQTSKCNQLNGDRSDAPRLPRRNQKLGLSNGVMDLPTADPAARCLAGEGGPVGGAGNRQPLTNMTHSCRTMMRQICNSD